MNIPRSYCLKRIFVTKLMPKSVRVFLISFAKAGVKKSNNYKKQSLKLAKEHAKIANVREDFLHKLSSCLLRHFSFFGLENLNTAGMMKNPRLAKSLAELSSTRFNEMINYKLAQLSKSEALRADRFYPSSKTCSSCGAVKEKLSLGERIYSCDACGSKMDRDFNAKSSSQGKRGAYKARCSKASLA